MLEVKTVKFIYSFYRKPTQSHINLYNLGQQSGKY